MGVKMALSEFKPLGEVLKEVVLRCADTPEKVSIAKEYGFEDE